MSLVNRETRTTYRISAGQNSPALKEMSEGSRFTDTKWQRTVEADEGEGISLSLSEPRSGDILREGGAQMGRQ